MTFLQFGQVLVFDPRAVAESGFEPEVKKVDGQFSQGRARSRHLISKLQGGPTEFYLNFQSKILLDLPVRILIS